MRRSRSNWLVSSSEVAGVDLNTFWHIIEESRSTSDTDQQLDFITSWFQQATDPEALDFERILKLELMSESNLYLLSFAFGAVCMDLNWTDDTFDHLRAWLVLQGEESFYSVCRNPDELASFETVRECATLLALGDNEWRRRHGSSSPIKIDHSPLKGEPQSQEQFEKLVFDDLELTFPRLFRTCKPMIELQWHPKDRQLLHLISDQGGKLDQLHPVDHVFICPNRKSADNVARELQRVGHTVNVIQTGWRKCEVHSKENTTLLALTRRTPNLMDLAKKYKSSYDGWGTSV